MSECAKQGHCAQLEDDLRESWNSTKLALAQAKERIQELEAKLAEHEEQGLRIYGRKIELFRGQRDKYKTALEKIIIVGLNLNEAEGEDETTLVDIAKEALSQSNVVEKG